MLSVHRKVAVNILLLMVLNFFVLLTLSRHRPSFQLAIFVRVCILSKKHAKMSFWLIFQRLCPYYWDCSFILSGSKQLRFIKRLFNEGSRWHQ